MTPSRRVLVAGRQRERPAEVAEAVAASAEPLTAEAVAVDGPAAVARSESAVARPERFDAVVWAGAADVDDLTTLVESVDGEASTPVVLYGDDDAPSPGDAFDAGVADYVRAGDGQPTVLERRLRRLSDGDRTGRHRSAATVSSDGGERFVEDGVAGGARRGERSDAHRGADRVLDRIDEGVVGIEDGQVTYVNERVEAIVGKSADELVGEDVWTAFPDTQGTVFEHEYRAALGSQAARTFEAYATELDAWLEVTVYPGGDGLSVYVRDVTARKRTEAELERNERALRDLQRLASDRDRSFDEKLDRALAIGCDRLGLPLGFLTDIDDDTQTIVASHGESDAFEPGSSVPLCEAYCRKAVETDGLLAFEHAARAGWTDDPAHDHFGLQCYLGGKLLVGGELYGTLCFGGTEPRDRAFTAAERTFIELLIEWVSYELERRERERELERYETIVRSVDVGVYELDADGRFTFVNPGMTAITGYGAAELVGEHVSTVRGDDATERALATLLAGDEAEQTVEATVRRERGQPVVCEDSMTALPGDDGVRGVVGVVRDVTEQTAHREMLSELVTSSRSLMQARDREAVAEMVAQAVETVLGFGLNVVRLYDRESDRLVPAGTTDEVTTRLGTPPAYDLGDGGPGRAFVDGETVRVDDVGSGDYGGEVVESAIHLPMGVHGTIAIGSEERNAFSDVDRRAAELLATSAAAAATRAKREQELREARERVDTLVDRVNGLIENTVEVLVQSATREELETGVVEQLVATDPYEFAWIGRPDPASEAVDASAWDGDVPGLAAAVESLSLDRAAARDAADPVALALDDESVQIVADLAEAPADSLHADAREAGLGSAIVVPLTYKDASYGVLCVYADERDAFAEREQVVLEALGRAIANAVNAVESGRILSTDRVVELEFTVRDAALPLSRLSARSGAALELTGSVYESEGRLRLYVTATGVEADDLRAALDGDEDVGDAGVVAEHDDEILFEMNVEDSLVELLADHGAVTRSAGAEDGVVRYAIELPYETEAREVFDLVADRYDGTDLVGYHEHERPVRTRQEFREAVADRFTDRQETAVRTAYLGGFFEWPRDVDGDDLAESMDIARPTYHQHLRAAQRKVFDELFDPHSGRRE